MLINRIAGWTRELGKSQGYFGLPVKDGVIIDARNGAETPVMLSAWEPTPGELQALNNGAPVILRVIGSAHPPVMVEVGQAPGDSAPVVDPKFAGYIDRVAIAIGAVEMERHPRGPVHPDHAREAARRRLQSPEADRPGSAPEEWRAMARAAIVELLREGPE